MMDHHDILIEGVHLLVCHSRQTLQEIRTMIKKITRHDLLHQKLNQILTQSQMTTIRRMMGIRNTKMNWIDGDK